MYPRLNQIYRANQSLVTVSDQGGGRGGRGDGQQLSLFEAWNELHSFKARDYLSRTYISFARCKHFLYCYLGMGGRGHCFDLSSIMCFKNQCEIERKLLFNRFSTKRSLRLEKLWLCSALQVWRNQLTTYEVCRKISVMYE